MKRLSLRERLAAAGLIQAGVAATVEEAIRSHREHVEANERAIERRRGFKVVE